MTNRLTIMVSVAIFGLVFTFIQFVNILSYHPVSSASPLIKPDEALHACTRDCSLYPEQRVCSYDFTAEWFYSMSKACYDCPFNATDCHRPHCIALNGVQRPVLTINRQIPGPDIQVCQGDRIQVKVHNMLDNSEGLTIHWHGQHQRHSPHMDGTSMITQCPVARPQSFTYDFVAETAGTHWWHSHSGLQRADGLFGPLIVRQGKGVDAHGGHYDVDDVEHVLMLSDWTNMFGVQHMMMELHADGSGAPDGLLINGRGTGKIFEQDSRKALLQHETFQVVTGLRYRFRTISTALTNCPLVVSVQDHAISVIASDGAPVKPILVEGFTVAGGERYDFVLHANKPINNYWIRVRGAAGSECEGLEELAILRYRDAPLREPIESPDVGAQNGVILNLPTVERSPEKPGVVDMKDADPIDPDILRPKSDVTHYIEVDSVYRNSPKLYHPLYYPVERGGPSYLMKRTHMLNNISFALPPAPVLTHHQYIPEFCTRSSLLATKGQDCGKEYCSCIQVIELGLGQVVDLVLVTKSMNGFEPHPLHLHGNHFYVMSYDNGDQLPLERIREIDAKGGIPRNLDHPPRKDTIMMARRHLVLRFKADNPGWWLFHCHMDLHQELGMALIFRVGEDSDLPSTPPDMPVCVKGVQEPCGVNPAAENLQDGDVTLPRCKPDAVTPDTHTTRNYVPYLAILSALLIALACMFTLNIRRIFQLKEDKARYRRLSGSEFEMSL